VWQQCKQDINITTKWQSALRKHTNQELDALMMIRITILQELHNQLMVQTAIQKNQ